MLIGYLIQSYISQHNLTLAGFCRRLGYYEKTVNGWLFKRHRPSKTSLDHLLILFTQNIPETERDEYTKNFWYIVQMDKDISCDR
jgi:transcriptional regulator with XRE-family HTH domain